MTAWRQTLAVVEAYPPRPTFADATKAAILAIIQEADRTG
jgi:hypothetical protein